MLCELCKQEMKRIRTNIVVEGNKNVSFTVNLYKCELCNNSIIPIGEQKRLVRKYDLVVKEKRKEV